MPSNKDQSVHVPRCGICAKVCKTWQGLSSHERNRHNLGCPLCDGGAGQACWWHFL